MSIDLSKLTPAPWRSVMGMVVGGHVLFSRECENYVMSDSPPQKWHDGNGFVDLRFVALARNAFDVMMKRHLEPQRIGEMWGVDSSDVRLPEPLYSKMTWPDPFTALIEADKWLTEQEVKQS